MLTIKEIKNNSISKQDLENITNIIASIINKNDSKFLLNNFLRNLIKICYESILIYDDNKLVAFLPIKIYFHKKKIKQINLKVNSNSKKNKIYKEIIDYFWNILFLLQYETIKQTKKFAFIFTSFIYDESKVVKEILFKKINEILSKKDINSFYFADICNDKKLEQLKNEKYNIYFHQKIKINEYENMNITFFKFYLNESNQTENNKYINILDQKIDINKLTINYFKCKNNNKNSRKIFMIHGVGATSNTWTEIIKLLNSDFDVYTITLPLHGNSVENGYWDIFKYSVLISKYIKNVLKLNDVIIWGHSMGGAIAVCTNNLISECISKIILESPYAIENKRFFTLLKLMVKNYQNTKNKWKLLLKDQNKNLFYEQFKKTYSNMNLNTINFLLSLFHKNILIYLNHSYKLNNKETIVLFGKNDFVLDWKSTKLFFNKLEQNIKFVSLDDCWHSPHKQKTKLVYDITKKFINND